MPRAKGIIGDVHGIPDELKELVTWMLGQGLEPSDIWVLGDLVDRGPDSGEVVRYCRSMGINSILGNHEKSIINRWNGMLKGDRFKYPNPDKEKTISQLTQADIDWMNQLPPIHVFDDLQLVLVHGGVWPTLPFYKQPSDVIRAQLIQWWNPGKSKWWGPECLRVNGKSEEDMVKAGWRRWYELYDHHYDVAFGHSVFQQPMIYKRPGYGTCFGLDQGGVFGGWLTGMIYHGKGDYHIKQVRAREVYHPDMMKQFGGDE